MLKMPNRRKEDKSCPGTSAGEEAEKPGFEERPFQGPWMNTLVPGPSDIGDSLQY